MVDVAEGSTNADVHQIFGEIIARLVEEFLKGAIATNHVDMDFADWYQEEERQ